MNDQNNTSENADPHKKQSQDKHLPRNIVEIDLRDQDKFFDTFKLILLFMEKSHLTKMDAIDKIKETLSEYKEKSRVIKIKGTPRQLRLKNIKGHPFIGDIISESDELPDPLRKTSEE